MHAYKKTMSMQSIKLCNIWLLPLKEIDSTNTHPRIAKVDTFTLCFSVNWPSMESEVGKLFVEQHFATCFRFSFRMWLIVCRQEQIAQKCNRSVCIQLCRNTNKKVTSSKLLKVKTMKEVLFYIGFSALELVKSQRFPWMILFHFCELCQKPLNKRIQLNLFIIHRAMPG